MRVVSIGIDVVEIAHLKRIIQDLNTQFVDRCFTQLEQTLIGQSVTRVEGLAGRFAAKEAVAKALGTGFSEGITPLDIEIGRLESGAPQVILRAGAANAARVLGISEWKISISHSASTAVASVIALGGEGNVLA